MNLMLKLLKCLSIPILLAAMAMPAYAVDLMSGGKPGSAASPNYPLPETKPSKAPEVEPRKSYIPGHESSYGGYVPGHYEEGPPLPPLPPGGKSKGYVPGHHDADGRFIPGHPK